MPERYLSVETFADRLDVSTRTVKRWISKRMITARRFRTGGLRIPASQMEKVFRPDINSSDKSAPVVNGNYDIDRLVEETIGEKTKETSK